MSVLLLFVLNVLPLLLSSILMLPAPNGNPFPPGNTLLVTAHPDDEVLFFSTAVQALTSDRSHHPAGGGELVGLCLSNGNADGLGSQRAGELAKAYEVLGVPQSRIILFNHPELQDDPTAVWNPDVIAETIRQVIASRDIQNVITFDERGVSLHPNHAAIARALPALRGLPAGNRSPSSAADDDDEADDEATQQPLRVFTLQTHAPLTKYISFLSVLPPFTLVPQLFPSGPHVKISTDYRGWWRAVRAMRAHTSQLTAVRWAYLLGSRYLWTGEYVQVQ